MSTRAHDPIATRVAADVATLCAFQPDRHVGSQGNRGATAWLAERFGEAGLAVERIEFECVDWLAGEVELRTGGQRFEAFPGPYSQPTDLDSAELVAIASTDELAALPDARGRILLLHGEIAREQLIPRNYPFYQTDEARRIHKELDRLQPAAVIGATGRNPGSAGALYPFPIAEDADFGFPSAYLRDVDGERLLAHAGGPVALLIDSSRRMTHAEQVIARRTGSAPGRVVLSAHVDARFGTPGAVDNAASVAVLLSLADLLGGSAQAAGRSVEFVPFNGEDNFAAYGEMAYLDANPAGFGDVALAINLDAAGYKDGTTHVSFYGADVELTERIREVFGEFETISEGPAWPQSDHMVFAMRGVPTIAITSSELMHLATEYTHTERDVPAILDAELLAETVRFLSALVERL